jgi:hypothetical protein
MLWFACGVLSVLSVFAFVTTRPFISVSACRIDVCVSVGRSAPLANFVRNSVRAPPAS